MSEPSPALGGAEIDERQHTVREGDAHGDAEPFQVDHRITDDRAKPAALFIPSVCDQVYEAQSWVSSKITTY
jgi:hypothetical protein